MAYERVNAAHPDKMCDRLAGAIVDLAYSKEENPRIAVEVLAGHGKVFIIIETSLRCEQLSCDDINPIVWRIFGNDVEINITIVPQDTHLAHNQKGGVKCGDNGIFKGCAPTHEQKLLTAIAASIYEWWPYDGKYIIQGKGRLAAPVFDLTVCQSHLADDEQSGIADIIRNVYQLDGDLTINPLGEWTGGPDTDSGATNRKLGSDMGDGVTGGGLHGKDLSKADVSVNIVAFLKAVQSGQTVTAICSIGDENVTFTYADGKTETERFADVVEQARLYIQSIGGFEKFAEWGLIRPENA